MILRFLRLFRIFRDLEAERDATVVQLREDIAEQAQQNLLLQDRIDNVLADRAKLWDMTSEAIGNEREALKMMANYRVQATFGITPFPESGHLPDARVPDLDAKATVGGFVLPSQRVAQATKKFTDELRTQILQANKH